MIGLDSSFIRNFSRKRKFSIGSLTEEIMPAVNEKNEFGYRKESKPKAEFVFSGLSGLKRSDPNQKFQENLFSRVKKMSLLLLQKIKLKIEKKNE